MHNIEICPACRYKYQVPVEFKGQKIVCKQCGTNFRLTLTDESQANDQADAADSFQEEVEEISQDDSYLLIGKLAVKYKFASVEQIKQALVKKEREKQAGHDLFLGEILVAQGIITQSQLDFLHSLQKLLQTRESDNQFAIIAVKNDFADQASIDQALSEQKRIFKESKTVKSIEDILVESGVLKAEQRDAILIRQKQLAKDTVNEKEQNNELDTLFKLDVSEDRLAAFILPKTEVTGAINIEQIKKYILSRGIKYGLTEDRQLAKYLKSTDKHQKPWKIAEGQPPTSGQEARIKYYFETDPLKIETTKEEAVFNFQGQEDVTPVKKGDLLAEKFPAEGCEPGMDVYGHPIPAPEPRDKKLRTGKGAVISEDGLKVVAGVDGVPRISVQGRVSVLPQLEIPGDVGLKSGHVDFEGDIQVAGSIQNGNRVKGYSLAAEEILRAEVETAGDIAVAGGIVGATINSGGNIRAVYIRDADIKAFGDVIVEKGIRESQIETSGTCIIQGGKILASTITAKKGIWAVQIGSDVSKPCTLAVGVDVRASNEIDKLTARVAAKQAERDKLTRSMQKLNQKTKETENKIGELAQLQDRTMVTQRKLRSKIEELQKAENHDQLADAEAALLKIEAEIKTMEADMEKLFDLQDRISERIAKNDQSIKTAALEIEEYEDRIVEITEWASNGDAICEVRVDENIFPDTTIDGTNSSVALKQKFSNVLIKEHGIRGADDKVTYQIKIAPLK